MKRLKFIIKSYIIKLLSKIYFYLEIANQIDGYNNFRKKYNIHPTFNFNGKGINFYGDGDISIDKNSYIGRHSSLQVSTGYKISIGKNCKIGPFFCVWTNSASVDSDFNNSLEIKPKNGSIIIQDAVWIGANVVISPGVKIGENSIIGANTMVTKDVPPFAIVGGVPAKILRYKNISKKNHGSN
ncbi:MAG: acyltransferase [Lutibacter sp.]